MNLANTTLTGDQRTLQDVASKCDDLCSDLIGRLDEPKISGTVSKRHVVKKLCDNVLQKRKLEKARDELEKQQDIINTQMLVTLMKSVDISSAQQQDIVPQIQAVVNTDLFNHLRQDLQQSVQGLLDRSLEGIRRHIQSSKHDLKERVLDHAEETRQDAKRIDLRQKHVAGLLDSLRFPTMHHREESIRKAHEATFKRVFEHDENDEWHDLVQWLKNDESLFWIRGKLGSGKFTLMSFIINHPQFTSSLNSWAGGAKVIVPRYFLWRAGSIEQKVR